MVRHQLKFDIEGNIVLRKLIACVLIALLIIALFLVCGCADKPDASAPVQTNPTTQNSAEQSTEPLNKDKWAEYSDYELMEMVMDSSQNEFRQFSAVWMTAEEWKEYMLNNCDPFRALMLRDTAKESLKAHILTVIHAYQGDLASVRAENFALLAMTIYPELQVQLQDIVISYPPRTGTAETTTLDISK